MSSLRALSLSVKSSSGDDLCSRNGGLISAEPGMANETLSMMAPLAECGRLRDGLQDISSILTFQALTGELRRG